MVASVSQIGAQVDAGRTRLAQNYETFLALLTAQLRNQDPLSPMDSNQFTAQLVQMAGVEQQILTNDLLKVLAGDGQGGLNAGVSYIGRDVTALWSTVKLDGGQAKWAYELGRDAASVTLEVLDGAGKTVWRGPAPSNREGLHDFVWDGRDSAGRQLADGGVYTLKITAASPGGGASPAQVLVRGRVTGVESYDGQAFLMLGKSLAPLKSVISVEAPAPAPG